MKPLEIWYPCKPFLITQAWGIKNPIYGQINEAFNRHNGIDFKTYYNAINFDLYSPLEIKITDVGNNSSAGNYIRFISTEKWLVNGLSCYVGGILCHLKYQSVSKGQICAIGRPLGVANNTGFSTGPHTHLSLYRLREDLPTLENRLSNRLDTNTSVNNTFDPQPYWTKFHAQDYGTVINVYRNIISTLASFFGVRATNRNLSV